MNGTERLPTILITRFLITASPTTVRIAIGDEVSTEIGPVYHHAFLLHAADARTFADMINNLLSESETKAAKP